MEFFTSKDWLNRGLESYAFQWDHLVFIALIIAVGVLLSWFLRKKDKKTIKIVLIVLWAIGLSLEISYYAFTYYQCANDPVNHPFELDKHLPLHSCLMFFYLFPVVMIFDSFK